MISSEHLPTALSGCWALAWTGESRLFESPLDNDLMLTLFHLWKRLDMPSQSRWPAWALSAQRLLPRDSFGLEAWGDCGAFIDRMFSFTDAPHRIAIFRDGATVVNWYRRGPLSDSEIIDVIAKRDFRLTATLREVLISLGAAGMEVVRQREGGGASRPVS
jgi:hypothetical protein